MSYSQETHRPMSALRVLAVLALVTAAVSTKPVVLISQTTPAQPNAPLELPDFLVTGKAVVDVAAGAKNLPSRPPTFSLQDLDSLNPTEKLPPPLAARRPLPLFKRTDAAIPGYVAIEGGAYVTPSVLAGYSTRSGGYTLDLAGALEHSQGWIDGSGYTTAQAGLNTSYVAPEKFLFFGRGLTETDIRFRHQSYTLYGDSAMRERSTSSLSAGLTTEAKIDSVSVLGAFSWSRLSMETSTAPVLPQESATDNAVSANVSATWLDSWLHSNVNVDARIQSLNGASYSFVEAGYGARFSAGNWSVSTSVAPQYAVATSGDDRFGLAVKASAEIAPWLNSLLRVEAFSGMRGSSYTSLARMNPYMLDSAAIDHAYDKVAIRGSILYAPGISTSLMGTLELRSTERELIWEDASDGRFVPSFRSVSMLKAGIEGTFSIGPRDLIMGELILTSASTQESQVLTYVPLVQATVAYERAWSENLRSTITLVFLGQRWADLANTKLLDAFVDLRLNAVYTVSRAIDVQLTGENLVNSSVFLWNNYKGRGIFVSLGLLWKF